MSKELSRGISLELTEEVTPDKTAEAIGSGMLPVYATPAMIALMEHTALGSVAPYLEEGTTTVGTMLNVKHTAPSVVGSVITCESELIEIDRRRLVFTVRAFDEAGEIGSGTHERFIVDCEKFFTKANERKAEK